MRSSVLTHMFREPLQVEVECREKICIEHDVGLHRVAVSVDICRMDNNNSHFLAIATLVRVEWSGVR